ncbi:ABC transporter substrate-binding protein [Pseudonocardia hispaniensis]|uniref:ABC transporter substrate-binding protein n=1 Tax=Pseudonocardia hispaniensis TaxID=904933 RepID=A0ABW1IYZ4_9PSEU
MVTSAARWSGATAQVSHAGVVRDRPLGAVTRHAHLTEYLQAAARLGSASPLSFLWIGDLAPDPPGSVEAGGRLRVRITAGRLTGSCEVELDRVEPDDVAGLSGRELQVLTLLACGLTNPEIAVRLGVSRRTVATHVERVLSKLEVPSRAAAAALALDRGLLALPLPGTGLGGLAPVGLLRLEAEVRGAADAMAPAPRRSRPPRRRPLVIGAVYPANRDSARDGQQMQRGAQLAVEEINRRGGVGGRLLEHLAVPADATRGAAIRAAVEQLVARDVDAITIGYTFERSRSGLAAQFGPASVAGCPLLHHSTSASAARLVADEPDRFGNVFQVCAQESTYGAGFLRTLNALRDSGRWSPRSTRLLVLDSADPDLTTFPVQARDAAERSGWQPVVDHIGPFEPDWRAAVDRIHALDPAAVMIACFSAPQTASFLHRFREAPTDALLYALYSPSIPEFLEQAGTAAEDLLWATVTGRYNDSFGNEFGRRFRHRYHAEPGMSSAGIHYDIVHLLAATWSQCDTTHDFRQVNNLLRNRIHRGVNGAYHLGTTNQTNLVYPDESADPSIAQAHLVYQIQAGQHRIIAPAPYPSAPFRPPAPEAARRPAAAPRARRTHRRA